MYRKLTTAKPLAVPTWDDIKIYAEAIVKLKLTTFDEPDDKASTGGQEQDAFDLERPKGVWTVSKFHRKYYNAQIGEKNYLFEAVGKHHAFGNIFIFACSQDELIQMGNLYKVEYLVIIHVPSGIVQPKPIPYPATPKHMVNLKGHSKHSTVVIHIPGELPKTVDNSGLEAKKLPMVTYNYMYLHNYYAAIMQEGSGEGFEDSAEYKPASS